MASGFDLHGTFQFQGVGAAAVGGGGLLKRSLTELEKQQQIQQAIFLRSVKQRTHLSYPISPLSPLDLSAASSGCDVRSPACESSMRDCLQELERQLFDDEDDDEVSGSGSAVTVADFGETMKQLISSPANSASSSSSSYSSSATCTPSRQLLLDTAAAISEGNLEAAVANLAVLKRAANPMGDPDQRLTAMMVAALISRINPPPPGSHPVAALCSGEQQAAVQLLYDISPCFKLALLASNFAILDATRDSPKIHIVDFDVGLGGQYASLIQAFADRHRRNPLSVKITAVTDPTSPLNAYNGVANGVNLRAVGDRLARLAERFGVGLRFSIVSRRPAELDRAALGCEAGECLVVNLAFQLSRVADESVSPANPRDEVLRQVQALSPRLVALAEQDLSGNTAPFAARFAAACGYYGAVLESLDATASRESADRARAEGCLARRAVNSVAREGEERVERCEVFGKWRARMGMAGFRPIPVGPAVVEPVKGRLCSGLTVNEENGGLCFGWMGRVLTVASTWH